MVIMERLGTSDTTLAELSIPITVFVFFTVDAQISALIDLFLKTADTGGGCDD